jgi:hypothetical protein
MAALDDFDDDFTEPTVSIKRKPSTQRSWNIDPDQEESLASLQNQAKKPNLSVNDFDQNSEYSEDQVDEYSVAGSADYPEPEQNEERLTYEQMQNEKIKYLSKLDRLKKRGVYLERSFTMKSDLLEIKEYYDRLTHGKHVENGVKMCEKTLRFCINGIEALNKMYDPFDVDLDGWGEEVDDDITDGNYQEVFEELYEKYSGKSSMAPEIKLLLMVVGGGAAFNLKKKMQKRFFMNGGTAGSAPGSSAGTGGMRPNPNLMNSINQRATMPPPQQDVNEIVRKMKEELQQEQETKQFNVKDSKKKNNGINIEI